MNTIIELGVASTTSYAICSQVSTDNLLTALITFGVSLITLVGGELIKFLVAYFKKKTKKLEEDKEEEKK